MSSEREPGQPVMVKTQSRQWRGVLREYADRLNISDATPIVTLGEGGTPLIPAAALSRAPARRSG
jgi:threonine synthase